MLVLDALWGKKGFLIGSLRVHWTILSSIKRFNLVPLLIRKQSFVGFLQRDRTLKSFPRVARPLRDLQLCL